MFPPQAPLPLRYRSLKHPPATLPHHMLHPVTPSRYPTSSDAASWGSMSSGAKRCREAQAWSSSAPWPQRSNSASRQPARYLYFIHF
eukprot:scaffold48_cov18-Tisochrysis_lutea.AAC.2